MLVDAIHEATGKPVYIKEVPTDSEELRISQLLTQEEWASDSRNHCVGLMKVFKDHKNPNVSYMVMPFLRPADNPPFESTKEIIKFTDQILEVNGNRFVTFAPNLNIVRVWYSFTRNEWHTGMINRSALVSRLTSIQRLRHAQPYDGCRHNVSPRFPPRHSRVQSRLFWIGQTYFKDDRQGQILLHRLWNFGPYT